MANDEHVALLKKGVDAWNAWRDDNPDIWPDLTNARLEQANLRGADLRKANLTKANLAEANLRETKLSHANLETLQPTSLARGAPALDGAYLDQLKRAHRNIRQRLSVAEQDLDILQAAPSGLVLIDPALTSH
jgi:uncharacterized protein YjbI with pentapeptide repeats